jgi:uncharacterized protein
MCSKKEETTMDEFPFDTKKLIPLFKESNVIRAGIFGSMARGDWDNQSDIDILVEFSYPVGLFKMVHLKNLLAELLQREVDLVTPAGLSPYLKEDILKDLRLVYEA